MDSPDLKRTRRQRAASRPTVDRLPPHNDECEEGALGCCLISPNDCIPDCIIKFGDAKHEVFYDLRRQEIFKAMCEMIENREQVDIITLQSRLKDKGLLEQCGGLGYLARLPDTVPSAANLSYYLDHVWEKHQLRKLIHTCTDAVARVYEFEGEADALINEVERDILAIRKDSGQSQDIKTLVQEAITQMEFRVQNPDTIKGLSTGLKDLDKMSDGLHEGEMIVVAALPSRGKTVLGVNIAVHNALSGIHSAVFSAEMQPVQLVIRSICSESRANHRKLLKRDCPRMVVAAGKLANSTLHIERASGWSIGQIRAKARRLQQQFGIKLAVIDHLQMLKGTGDTKEQEVNSISKGVKEMAFELNIPVILLSQINDKGETKYARAVAEDADSLWKLENDGEWQKSIQPLRLNIEKSRDGETGSLDLVFFKEHTRIEQASKVSDEDVPK